MGFPLRLPFPLGTGDKDWMNRALKSGLHSEEAGYYGRYYILYLHFVAMAHWLTWFHLIRPRQHVYSNTSVILRHSESF